MRWLLIDTFVEFSSRARASAVKCVSGAEDYLKDHVPGLPIVPAALLIEGMAQTAGILVGEADRFERNVILAKIRRAEFTDAAMPGDLLRFDAVLETLDERAAVTTGRILKNGVEMGLVDLIFSRIRPNATLAGLPAGRFVFDGGLLALLGQFRDSVNSDGEHKA